jgi:hypothetical protein
VADLFDFILVMVSLVLAIGVTHLVHGVANLIRLRGDTRLEPLPLVWAASLFLVGAQYWWSLLHIAASLLVSTDAVERGASLQSEFERIRVPFMVVMAAFSVVVAFDGWILGVEPVWTDFRPIQMWVVALYAAGAAVAGTRTQHMVGGLVLVSYLVAGLFFRYMPGAYGS